MSEDNKVTIVAVSILCATLIAVVTIASHFCFLGGGC
jgi:hypothetical protein